MKKVLTVILTAVIILFLVSCGQDNNTGSLMDEDSVKTDKNVETADVEETFSQEEGAVPWDEMAPLSTAVLPIGDKDNVLDKVTFFPDILFPAEYDLFDGGCSARLDSKEYGVYAYVESHRRNIEPSGSDLYYAEVGDYTIYVISTLFPDIQLKNNASNYLINISLKIVGADDELKAEYVTKNCDYIKEQLETLEGGTDTTQIDGQSDIAYNNTAEIDIDGIYGMYQHTDNTHAVTIGIEYYTDDWGGPFNVTVDGDSISCGNEWKPLDQNTIVVKNENAVLVATFYENGMDISVMEANDDVFYNLEGSYVLTESWNDIS